MFASFMKKKVLASLLKFLAFIFHLEKSTDVHLLKQLYSNDFYCYKMISLLDIAYSLECTPHGI